MSDELLKSDLNQKGKSHSETQDYTFSETISEYVQEYANFFEGLQNEPQLDAIVRKLAEEAIQYIPSASHQTYPSVSIYKKSQNSQIVILMMKWGRFLQKISVVNFQNSNPYLSSADQRQTLKCILYERRIGDQKIIFKSHLFEPNNQSCVILSALKEVFIAKIASALEFGPICCVGTCFDVFLYEDSVQFGMEKCVGYRQRSFKRLSTDSLRQGLRLMHFLKIIHYDIKPDNIMFSETLGKLVMIDFNLSAITDFQKGKKTPIAFRGTINFCCPEMAENFLFKNKLNFVDPYYNDIYCLKESLMFIKQQPVEGRVYDILENLIQSQNQQDEFLLLKLKFLLFSQEWKKGEKFYSQFRYQLQGKAMIKVTEFMYELDVSQDLQFFYNTYIPPRQRESLFMREFNHLLAKKWMTNIHSSSTKSKKRSTFERRLELTVEREIYISRLIDKKECLTYLQKDDKFTNEKAIYFNIFLDYVSYHCNQYRVNADQRQKAASICSYFIKKDILQNYHKNAGESSGTKLNQTQNEMEFVLKFIMKWIIKNLQDLKQQKSSDFSKGMIFRETLRKLLPFIFILDVGTLSQNLVWFDGLLQGFADSEDQLAVALSLRHLNEWNKYRIKPKKDQMKSRLFVYWKIGQLIDKRIKEFTSKISSEFRKFLKQYLSKFSNTFSQNISHSWLREQLDLQILYQYIDFSLSDYNFLQQIQKYLIQRNTKTVSQFKHFYFPIYNIYRGYGQIIFCQYIYKTFSNNLKDPRLQQDFSIYYYHKSINPISLANVESVVDSLVDYISKIDGEYLTLNSAFIVIIEGVVSYLQQRRKHIAKQKYFALKEKVELFYKKLKSLHNVFHKNKQHLADSFSIHTCINLTYLLVFYLFNLKSYKTIDDYNIFLQENQSIQYYKSCIRCHISLHFLYLLCLQIWLIHQMPQNAVQLFRNLQEYFEFICIQIFRAQPKDIQYFESLKFRAHINSAIFYTFINETNSKHQSLLNLYRIIKYKKLENRSSQIWIYLGPQQAHKMLLKFTLACLLQREPEQFLCFLQMLAEHLDNNISERNFNILIWSFGEIVSNLTHESQLQLYERMKDKSSGMGAMGYSFRIYFYVFTQYIQDPATRRRAFVFIARSLSTIPFHFQNHYSSEIHRYFVMELRRSGRQFNKQETYLNNQLVRLFIRLGMTTVNEKRYPTFKNKHYKQLVYKLETFKGLFEIYKYERQHFFFQIKRKSRRK